MQKFLFFKMDSSSSFVSSIPQTRISDTLTRHSLSPPRICIPTVSSEKKLEMAINSWPTPTNFTTLHSSPSTKNPLLSTEPLLPKRFSVKKYKTQPLPSQTSLVPTLLNTLSDIINKVIDPPTQSSFDPRFVLSGNFAPVEEFPPAECEIEGVLPSCLDGVYIRNGPNPQFFPCGPYHLFEGDGMLHSIRMSDGKVTFCSRYVKTYKYMVEREAGCNILPNVLSGFNSLLGFVARGTLSTARIFARQYNPRNGIGSANTGLTFFGNKLYALCEFDLPYEVKLTPNGDIQTVGRDDFQGNLFLSMTAHPKVDPETGEAFAFRYGLIPPFLTFFHFDSNGNKQADVPIFSLTRQSFLHDFAITKKYAIFPDIQVGLDLVQMILKGESIVSLDPTKLSRIGVIPRYAKDEKDMRWFNVPGLNILHAINAWDEVDEHGNEFIVMVAPNTISADHLFKNLDLVCTVIEKVRINLTTGVVSRQPLSEKSLDLAVINPNYVGKKNKYIYSAVVKPIPKIAGVVKLDVSMAQDQGDCIVASRMFEPGCYGSEPFFVATHPDDLNADEDEGFLVSYVHDENTGESRFLVMEAKSANLDVVASVKLPQRVPYGFHGLFVREKDLKEVSL